MEKILNPICFLGSMLLTFSSALASDSKLEVNPIGESVTTTPEISSHNILEDFYINYFATYEGATIDQPLKSTAVSVTGTKSQSSINLNSEVTAAYMITKDFGAGVDIPFYVYPVKGQGVVMQDIGLKVVDFHTVNYSGLHINTNLYIQAPTSDYSQLRKEKVGFKTTPSIRYDIAGSRFSLGSWNEIKDYAGAQFGDTFKLYALPYISYQMTPRVSAVLGYEMETHHNVGDSGLNFTSYETDLQPGIAWMITPKVIVNPYLQFFTGNSISFDSTALGAVISATL